MARRAPYCGAWVPCRRSPPAVSPPPPPPMSQRCIAALLRHITTQTVAPSHVIIFVSRLTIGQAMRACSSPSPLRAGRLCRSVVSCAWLAVSQHAPAQPSHGPVPLLCHDTMYCIVTKTGKWAVAHPAANNFFFFLCSSYCKTIIYIYIYIYIFSCLQ